MTNYILIGFAVVYLFQVVVIALQDYRAKQYRQIVDEQNRYIRNITDSFALLQLEWYLEDALENEDYEKAEQIKKLMNHLDIRL